jgi:hypothetical protein
MEMIKHDDYLKNLSPERRRKIKARASELLTEEMTLRQLRKTRQRSLKQKHA